MRISNECGYLLWVTGARFDQSKLILPARVIISGKDGTHYEGILCCVLAMDHLAPDFLAAREKKHRPKQWWLN